MKPGLLKIPCCSYPLLQDLFAFIPAARSGRSCRFYSASKGPDSLNDSTVHPHLRPPRKLRQLDTDKDERLEGKDHSKVETIRNLFPSSDRRFSVVSFCTAEQYRLEDLKKRLQKWRSDSSCSSKYQLVDSFLTEELVEDAVHYKVARPSADDSMKDQGDIFIFGEGAAVFWNVPKEDAQLVLKTLHDFEIKPYRREIVDHEAEYIDYTFTSQSASTNESGHDEQEFHRKPLAKLRTDGVILLDANQDGQTTSLVKYAFSDAIALSVKLAVYEALLQEYIDSVETVVEDMKTRGIIALSQDQVMKKTGELFFLRHRINLGSHMLDPPDFYWDRENLETLYKAMSTYLNIPRRTRIINEKLNHCDALVELLREQLHNKHSVRLELMIIWLICIEVFFEFLYYFERWFQRSKDKEVPQTSH